jgi:two-component system response regulator FlrC
MEKKREAERAVFLVVEDDRSMREVLRQMLETVDGWQTVQAAEGGEALRILARQESQRSKEAQESGSPGAPGPSAAVGTAQTIKAVLTDLKMAPMDGMTLLKRLSETRPDLPVVVLTAHGSVPGAVEAMKLGAFDFLTKPVPSPQHLRDVMARALEMGRQTSAAPAQPDQGQALSGETAPRKTARSGLPGQLRSRAQRGEAPVEAPVGRDPGFEKVLELARAVAPRDTTVLIVGESGTGKEVVARYVHDLSPRREKPFVAINCAAIPDTLLESELFGHERGAFTGATAMRRGILEQAHTGSLLLDEVAELNPALQAKFLRVLEQKRVVRVGGTKAVEVDVRLLAATNRDLEKEVAAGRFREDLFFRLNVFPLPLPPLRQRPADILLLARHFLDILGSSPGKTPPVLSPEAEGALMRYDWPGNVRELQNVLERAVILAGSGQIQPGDLGLPEGEALQTGDGTRAAGDTAAVIDEPAARQGLTLKELERRAVEEALAATDGNRRKAAERLGIALRTLQYKIKEYGLK